MTTYKPLTLLGPGWPSLRAHSSHRAFLHSWSVVSYFILLVSGSWSPSFQKLPLIPQAESGLLWVPQCPRDVTALSYCSVPPLSWDSLWARTSVPGWHRVFACLLLGAQSLPPAPGFYSTWETETCLQSPEHPYLCLEMQARQVGWAGTQVQG